MAGIVKRILRSRQTINLAANAVAFYIRLVHATSRWETRGVEHAERYWASGAPFIGTFWHGRLFMMPLAWTTARPMRILASRHSDGDLTTRAMEKFSIGAIRGSAAKGEQQKGGSAALRQILRHLKQGGYTAITPDGPRGPRMRVSPGLIAAARLGRVPILPATYGVARRTVLSTWDRFIIPWPFNRGVYLWGEPIDVYSDPDEPLEAAALRVEAAMLSLSAEADRLCGQPTIEPAAPPEPARHDA
ncbi:MAG TPA: lysophospholipid acyltransferase family protein [Ferrovibrio sp.]|jgi:lysophospholipid acyltransferase (LPLAT)-like uncharacterized protein|uniref:lysophospholipid acyltransferase family protein n=1 Tax=Ferrovibrio sp. TaxID=1917215 RepID=UPI002ED2ED9E